MKRYSIFILMAALLLSLFAFEATNNVSAFARKTPQPLPKATRQPKATRTPQPTNTPEPIDTPDTDPESANIVPTSPGAMTSTIIVFNPDTSGAATVQVDVYNTGGAIAYTTTQTVNANGAKLITLPGSLGTNFQGSAVVSSDKNVQALTVNANGANTARDAYEGVSASATHLTIPFARHLAMDTQNSILALQNTTDSDASVTVTFYNPDGSPAHQNAYPVAAHQPLYLNTNNLFATTAITGTIDISANQNVVAALQSLYFKDTTSVRAQTSAEQDTMVFLNFVERKTNKNGAPANWSEIYVRNNGTNPTDITLNLYGVNGASLGAVTRNGVNANGMAQFVLRDGEFANVGNSYVGWAKVTSSGEKIGAVALDVIGSGKRLDGVDGLANAQLTTRYVCGDTARSANVTSQLQILNTEARNARVLVRLFDPNTGAKLVQTKVVLAPNAVTTVKLSDAAFAAAGTSFQGMTIVQARGKTPPKISVTAVNPYSVKKVVGTTGYSCSGF